VDRVTTSQVSEVARRRLAASARTIGWFQPLETGA
jgi:hypothetical protein